MASKVVHKRSPRRSGNLFELDKPLWEQGFERLAGVDEAGRGPLAGPVVAAAAIFEPGLRLRGLDDSKRLTVEQRESIYGRIMERAVAVGVGMASAEEIDSLNILEATKVAAGRALAALKVEPDCLVTDCLTLKTSTHLIAEPKADQRSHAVAAASVVAKVTRDRLMRRLAEEFPGYGLELHKGYPTQAHYRFLRERGPATIHRRSFAGVDFFGQDAVISKTLARLRGLAASGDKSLAAEVENALEMAAGFLPEVEIREIEAMEPFPPDTKA